MKRLILIVGMIAYASNSWAVEETSQPLDLSSIPEKVVEYWKFAYRAAPKYPSKAAERGTSGCAIFSYVISSDGKAEEIELVHSAPKQTFVKAARRALKKYRWEATSDNTDKQAVKSKSTLSFSTSSEQFDCDASLNAAADAPKKKKKSRQCRPTTGSRLGRKC